MNSYERVMNRIEGKPVDRIPNLSIIMQLAGRLTGHPYDRIIQDYRLFADGMCYCQERFSLDCLWAISDPMREAEGMGAVVVFPEDGVPYAPEPLIQTAQDIEKLHAVSPEDGRRMLDRLEAIRVFHERAAGELPVIGWCEGPFAEACDLMGLEEVMVTMLDEEEQVYALLEKTLEQEILFAEAQIRAGADIIGIGDAAASLIGRELYETFALPYEKRLIRAIEEAGRPVKLHICGNINPILDLVMESGARIVDCDHMVDLNRAAELAAPHGIALCGNFDPVGELMESEPERIREAVIRCVNTMDERGLIAPGCEVPPDTAPENLEAVHQTLCELGGTAC